MTLLPRLKPQPIPEIVTVPETLAEGDLARAYDETRTGFGVPWMGVVAMAFAQFPTFYRTLWDGLGPVAPSRAFGDACATLRTGAEDRARALQATPLRDRLAELGYSGPDLEAIGVVIEVFGQGNMPYLLMATMARLLLEGHEIGGEGDLTAAAPRPPVWPVGQPLTLMEAHHQNASGRALFEDIKFTLGLPVVNTDYRALARWPSYFEAAWTDLKPHIPSRNYGTCVQDIHEQAVALARDLPNPAGLTSEALRAAARADGGLDEVLAVVQLFQWLLPGLVANVAVFQAQLER